MKIKQLFLGSAVALMALTACNKNGANTSVPTPEVGGTAGLLRIEISSANGGLRAATVDGPNADPAGAGIAGTTGEQGVTNVSTYVFNPTGGFVDSHDYTTKGSETLSNAESIAEADAAGKFLVENNETLVLPFKTTATPGVQNKLFVVVNKPSFFPTSFANIAEFTDAVNKALAIQDKTNSDYTKGFKEIITDNKFMMVGMCPNFKLKAGLTYEQVKGDFSATTLEKNQFLLTVNRVASKLVVDYTAEAGLFTKKFGTGDAQAKLLGYSLDGGKESEQKLYYTLANSNKAMVIYNNPNVNDQGTGDDLLKGVLNANYVTPNMDKVTTESDLATAYKFYKDFFYRISEGGDNNKVDATTTTPFTPIELAMQTKTPDYSKGVYFMEVDNTTGNWLWANTPVAKIYACVLPSTVYYLKDNNTTLASKTITSLSDLTSIKEPTGIETISSKKDYEGSFFMGNDNRYYASQAAANVGAGKAYNDPAPATTKLYIKGRCVYRFPVNADDYDYTNFKNAYNKRNHIYALTISDIAGIGDNYDPTDPTDPNVPKPTPEENPNEPTVDPNKPIAKSTVYAAVKATIANWTVVKNSVTLGK